MYISARGDFAWPDPRMPSFLALIYSNGKWWSGCIAEPELSWVCIGFYSTTTL